MLVRVSLSLVGLVPLVGAGEELADLAAARALAEDAVAFFQDEKFVEGYGALLPYWPLEPEEIQNLAGQTADQWSIVRQRFGTTVGTQFVGEAIVADSFARYTYLPKFRNHAIRWIFTFYKADSGWVVNGVSWDDNVDLLFEQ